MEQHPVNGASIDGAGSLAAQHEPDAKEVAGSCSKAGPSQHVLEKLVASEQQRRAERAKRQEDQRQQANPQESVQAFLASFSSKQATAEAQLQAAAPATAGADTAALQQTLDELAAVMVEQDKRVAEASYFLPSFDLRACTLQVQEFKAKLDAARASALPKKKFAFSSKVSRVKGAELPATAPTTSSAAVSSTDGTPATSLQAAAGKTEDGKGAAAGPSDQDLALVASGQGISGLHDQVIVRTASELAGQDFVVMDCTGCQVHLLGQMGAVRLLRLRGCTVVTGPVPGATFVDDVQDCTLMLASYQVRIHRAVQTDFYLRVRSRPIIEHSTGVRVAPYPAQQPPIQAHLQKCNLSEENELYKQVDDFGWIKAVQSPNWSVLPEDERKPVPAAPEVLE